MCSSWMCVSFYAVPFALTLVFGSKWLYRNTLISMYDIFVATTVHSMFSFSLDRLHCFFFSLSFSCHITLTLPSAGSPNIAAPPRANTCITLMCISFALPATWGARWRGLGHNSEIWTNANWRKFMRRKLDSKHFNNVKQIVRNLLASICIVSSAFWLVPHPKWSRVQPILWAIITRQPYTCGWAKRRRRTSKSRVVVGGFRPSPGKYAGRQENKDVRTPL